MACINMKMTTPNDLYFSQIEFLGPAMRQNVHEFYLFFNYKNQNILKISCLVANEKIHKREKEHMASQHWFSNFKHQVTKKCTFQHSPKEIF